MKAVTWRFKSKALIPASPYWTNWMHCTRETMLATIKILKQTNEASQERQSPRSADYRVVDEVEVIDYEKYGMWRWTESTGWQWETSEDGTPHGKGKRPTRKSKAEREADRVAADNEIFGT